MVEFKWIKMSLFLIVLLQFRAVTGQDSSIIVRDGDSATFSCKNVIKGQDSCDSTTWTYSQIKSSTVVELINLGNITNNDKSDRLSVREDCSLVIKKVTVKDFGRYTCRQFDKSGQQQGQGSLVYLSVINIYEQNDADDAVTLSCSVLKYDYCQDTVCEWLYEGITDKLEETKGSCSAKVTFKTDSVDKKLFKCKLTEHNGETRLCNFTPRTSCEKQGKSAETGNTTRVDNDNNITSANKDDDDDVDDDDQGKRLEWWWFLLVAVGLLILLIIVVVVVRRRRKPKGKKTKMDDGTVDAGDVSYASVSYIKKNDSRPRVQTHDDDDDDEDAAVTYSTVKISSSSAGASTDPNTVYATVNKPSQ